MSKFFKLKVILTVILGIIIGGLLFAFGEYDDSPGMCAIALITTSILFEGELNNKAASFRSFC